MFKGMQAASALARWATNWRLAVLLLLSAGSLSAQIAQPQPAAATCSGEARYQVTFVANWTAQSHAGALPANAHFSPMVVATHNAAGGFLQLLGLASPAVRQLAETGETALLKADLDAAFARGDVRAYRTGERIGPQGQSDVTLAAAGDRPLLSFIAMIAPSPDWLVALPGLSLCQEGEWLSSLRLQLPAMDAGTDSGRSFTAENFATTPPLPIHYLDRTFAPSASPDSQFGLLVIERKS